MKLTFRNAPHHLYPLIESKECPASSLKLFGYPLIVRNIMMAQKFMSVDTICLPDEFSDASRLIQNYFPTLNLKEFCDDNRGFEKYAPTINTPTPLNYHVAAPLQGQHSNFEIPINSLIHNSCLSINSNQNNDSGKDLVVDVLTYPWDFLKAVQDVLQYPQWQRLPNQVLLMDHA